MLKTPSSSDDRATEKGWGRTHPNPMVGALIVERGGRGRLPFGSRSAHAEVEAFGPRWPPQAGAEL